MKRLNTAMALLGLLISLNLACKTEPDAKAIRKEVLNIHDKLMLDGEKLIKNRMHLDTILIAEKQKKSADTAQMTDLISKLNQADEKMMDWMHFFKDDFKGKTAQEDLDYYKSQMIKIRAVEDDYIKLIRASDSVLKVHHISPVKKHHHVHQHKH
ncbi:hypothetical protein [Pedobacter sp.]|uniref:hypothetical protein n=1 Tax=Pedobacter sp. TaxID=1411316 RepID=UPI003BAD221F